MWLILAILAVPLIEIALFIVIGGAIGLWPTLIWVVLAAVLGVIVLKGVASLGPVSMRRSLEEVRDPLSPLAHRLMVAFGGGLLVLPGFMTDAVGLALLIPPLRSVILRLIGRRLNRLRAAAAGGAVIIEGDWKDVDRTRMPDPPPVDRTRH